MRAARDLARELGKIYDTMVTVDEHFEAEARMNAALHMSPNVRPAPLAVAAHTAREDVARLIKELEEEFTHPGPKPAECGLPDGHLEPCRRLE